VGRFEPPAVRHVRIPLGHSRAPRLGEVEQRTALARVWLGAQARTEFNVCFTHALTIDPQGESRYYGDNRGGLTPSNLSNQF
jgi:hypothetical protein